MDSEASCVLDLLQVMYKLIDTDSAVHISDKDFLSFLAVLDASGVSKSFAVANHLECAFLGEPNRT